MDSCVFFPAQVLILAVPQINLDAKSHTSTLLRCLTFRRTTRIGVTVALENWMWRLRNPIELSRSQQKSKQKQKKKKSTKKRKFSTNKRQINTHHFIRLKSLWTCAKYVVGITVCVQCGALEAKSSRKKINVIELQNSHAKNGVWTMLLQLDQTP